MSLENKETKKLSIYLLFVGIGIYSRKRTVSLQKLFEWIEDRVRRRDFNLHLASTVVWVYLKGTAQITEIIFDWKFAEDTDWK